jgi:nicotinamidase-related amidase
MGIDTSRNLSPELVVLLIDMQKTFVNNKEKKALIPRQIEILRACKNAGVPLIVVEYKDEGETLEPIKKEFAEFESIHKITKPLDDAFVGTMLEDLLQKIGAQKLLVMGVNACKCVYDTVSHAIQLGYEVALSNDLIAGYCNGPGCEPEFRQDWYRKNTHFFENHTEILGLMNHPSL